MDVCVSFLQCCRLVHLPQSWHFLVKLTHFFIQYKYVSKGTCNGSSITNQTARINCFSKYCMLSLHTPQRSLGWGLKVIFFLFSKAVKLHIKLNWKKCRPTCKVTFAIYTHHWPLGLGWRVKYCRFKTMCILFLLNKALNILDMRLLCSKWHRMWTSGLDKWDLCFGDLIVSLK